MVRCRSLMQGYIRRVTENDHAVTGCYDLGTVGPDCYGETDNISFVRCRSSRNILALDASPVQRRSHPVLRCSGAPSTGSGEGSEKPVGPGARLSGLGLLD